MNVYAGMRVGDKIIVTKNGRILTPRASLKQRNHSPDGFNWGYCGSGPAQLALAILLEELPPNWALRLYQFFKQDVVAGFAKEWWFYNSWDIGRWLDGYRGKIGDMVCDQAAMLEQCLTDPEENDILEVIDDQDSPPNNLYILD